MPLKTARVLREWCHWYHLHDVPLEHIASVLDMPAEEIRGLLAARRHKPDADAWPFPRLALEAVRRRKIVCYTALYVRRLAALGYKPRAIAELLILDVDALHCFVRRTRRLRSPRRDRKAPGELIRPRTASEELAHVRACKRASELRQKRELATPAAGWTYSDRSARTEAEDYARFMAAVRAARLEPAELLELSARVHYAPPAPCAPPVDPAIWTGASSRWTGRLTADQIAEAAELLRAGSSFPELATQYGCSVSTLRAHVDVGPLRRQSWPTEAVVYSHGVVRWDRAPAQGHDAKVWVVCHCGRERLVKATRVFRTSPPFTAQCHPCWCDAQKLVHLSPALSGTVALLAEMQENPGETGLILP